MELFNDEKSELADTMVVGRSENGMPVTISDEELEIDGFRIPTANLGRIIHFNYDPGQRCPFHIRKSTHRGAPPGSPAQEKSCLMARRGVIYSHRCVRPNKAEIEEMPTQGVGLLFKSFQRDLANQFGLIQQSWVNKPDFS